MLIRLILTDIQPFKNVCVGMTSLVMPTQNPGGRILLTIWSFHTTHDEYVKRSLHFRTMEINSCWSQNLQTHTASFSFWNHAIGWEFNHGDCLSHTIFRDIALVIIFYQIPKTMPHYSRLTGCVESGYMSLCCYKCKLEVVFHFPCPWNHRASEWSSEKPLPGWIYNKIIIIIVTHKQGHLEFSTCTPFSSSREPIGNSTCHLSYLKNLVGKVITKEWWTRIIFYNTVLLEQIQNAGPLCITCFTCV